MSALIEAWRHQQLTKPPFVLDADRETLASGVHTVQYSTLGDYTSSSEFANPNDTTLHLGLVPMPFVGDLQSADVFLVLLNPGLGPLDYYGEEKNEPGYREALLANLASDRSASRDGFMFLNARFAWTGGFRYWHGKLRDTISLLAATRGVSYCEAMGFLARRLAVLELIPYHSPNFRLPQWVISNLTSAQLARAYLHESILPKCRRGVSLIP